MEESGVSIPSENVVFYCPLEPKKLLLLSSQSIFHGVSPPAQHAVGVNRRHSNVSVADNSTTLFLYPIGSPKLRFRFSTAPASDSHSHAFEGPLRPPPHSFNRSDDLNRANSSDLWFAKVLSTLFLVKHHSLETFSSYLFLRVTPLNAYEAMRRIQDPNLAFGLFEFSREKLSVKHSFGTYDHLLRVCCQLRALWLADSVLTYMRSDGLLPDSTLVGALIEPLVESGRYDTVNKLLEGTNCQEAGVNAFMFNKCLSALVRQNRVVDAIRFFEKCMRGRDFRCMDTCTFNTLILGLCKTGDLDEAFRFLYNMEKFGCVPNRITYNTLITGLCKANEVRRGHELLKGVQGNNSLSPDVKTFTPIISGYCKTSMMNEAMTLFQEMTSSGIRPSQITFHVLIDGFGRLGDLASAVATHEKMLLAGYKPDVYTSTSLIHAYCQAGQVDDGLQLFHKMIARKLSPTAHTFSIIINALCKQNRVLEARRFLVELQRRNINAQAFMYNPVIDGLCKAGNLDEANLVVSEMEEGMCTPDKMTFTILIIGHCMKGRMLEAINFFNRMSVVKCIPDTITVNCLLSCLVKAGMAREAMQIAKQVAEENGIKSSLSCRSTPSSTSVDIPVVV